MSKEKVKNNPRYKQGIEKIILTDATFAKSSQCEFEPTWINFFYGNNGSGKTTISRAIRDFRGVSFKDNVSSDDFVSVVFNRDFVNDELNFKDATPTMPGVLMLGKESIGAEEKLKKKQEKIKNQEAKIGDVETEKDKKIAEQSQLNTDFQNAIKKTVALLPI